MFVTRETQSLLNFPADSKHQALPSGLSFQPQPEEAETQAWDGSWEMHVALEPKYGRWYVDEICLGGLRVHKSLILVDLEGKLSIPETLISPQLL